MTDMERVNSFIRTQDASGCGGNCPKFVAIYLLPLRPAWAAKGLKENKANKQIKPQLERGARLTKSVLCRTSVGIWGV